MEKNNYWPFEKKHWGNFEDVAVVIAIGRFLLLVVLNSLSASHIVSGDG